MQEHLPYLLLIALGFIAGFLNTIAGGGTLLTLPILIFMGLPAPLAQGTNRVAILLQTFTAVRGFKSKGVSTYPFSLYVGISSLFGATIGAYLALDFDGKPFNRMLAVVMIMVLVITVFNPNKNKTNLTEKLTGTPLVVSVIVFFFFGYLWRNYQCGNWFFNAFGFTLCQWNESFTFQCYKSFCSICLYYGSSCRFCH